ncbi:MAG: hypothetical protein LBK77_04580 [Spirochaetaceae bacterium]|jgi:hypothetical protein|nr:hypothetical protein [Spirochaetaceae bacterium]
MGTNTVFRILPVLLLTLLFAGCTSQPMTRNVVSDVGGVMDIDKFQYYISAGIKLTATERIREPNVDRRGNVSVKETAFRNIIIITKNTMGVLMDSKIGEDGLMVLEICFEENPADSDKRIIFKQDGPGIEHKFYIVYTDPRKRVINYGDVEYGLETNTRERVFLKIKIDKSQIEKERVRKVKGRRVEY